MADKKVLKPVSSPARQRKFRRGMTLDEKLKEIEGLSNVVLFEGALNQDVIKELYRLGREKRVAIAALRKCREQRDCWMSGAMHGSSSTEYDKRVKKGDAELLKILEGK